MQYYDASGNYLVKWLPSDDFESGGLSGGYGWLADWDATGNAAASPAGTPHGGTRHLRLQNSSSYIERSVNLAGMSNLRLQFWAKVDSFEAGDTVEALGRSNHTDWTTVKTWTSADSDNTYKFVDVDLMPYTMASELWIAFNSGMDSGNDEFYVDDQVIVRSQMGNSGCQGKRRTLPRLWRGIIAMRFWRHPPGAGALRAA